MTVNESSLRELNAAQTVSETDPFTERRYAQFASMLSDAKTVLDVGCNIGRGGEVLRSRLPGLRALHGVDFVTERLDALPPGLYDETFDVAVEKLRAPLRYDGVVAGEVIEHVPYDELDSFLGAIWNMLAPNGLLLLTTPNPHYLLLKRRSGGSVLGGSHLSVHCPVALAQYLRYRGFAIDALMGSGRISSLIGTRFPLSVYGSYLVKARRAE
jgi:2-polyprenyl-3-methyl-5-hydroxy-6-metoxy-1,4-benzoquinol methylase